MQTEKEALTRAVNKTLSLEGVNSNHVQDKGGVTRFGISQRFLEQVTGGPVSASYVHSLDLFEAKEIYRIHFWENTKINHIPHESLRFAVFDQAVNAGASSSIKTLQLCLSRLSKVNIAIDGIIGPKTLKEIQAHDEPILLQLFIQECQLRYARICQRDPSQLVFLVGWINRTWTYFKR